MNEIAYIRWMVSIVEAACIDRATDQRRFGDDFPMPKLPISLVPMGVSNLAAQIYNVAFEGWEEE